MPSPSPDSTQASSRNSAANPTPNPTLRRTGYPLTATDALHHHAYVFAQREGQQHLAQEQCMVEEQRMAEELEKQRAKMNSSVGGVNKNGVKFKIRERKR